MKILPKYLQKSALAVTRAELHEAIAARDAAMADLHDRHKDADRINHPAYAAVVDRAMTKAIIADQRVARLREQIRERERGMYGG